MLRFRGSLAFSVIATCLVTSPAWAQRSDQLAPMKGAPLLGIVTRMTPTEVTINVRGTDQKFSILDIKRLSFADDPRELTAARDFISDGQYESALDQLKKIAETTGLRDLVQQDIEFYIALCQARIALRGGGDKDAARQALLTFARNASQNFHFLESAELLGELSVSMGKFDDAARYYGFLAKTAKESSWAEYELRVSVLEGRVFEAQGKYPEALEKFSAVTDAAVETPEANREKNFARVGKAVALAETGKPDEGLKLIEEVIQKNDEKVETELFGRAYNAQGRCYQKLDNPKFAVLAYLHVDHLFSQHPDVHAEALYYLSKLWTAVNKADRAVAAHAQLTEQYAGSPWAKRQ